MMNAEQMMAFFGAMQNERNAAFAEFVKQAVELKNDNEALVKLFSDNLELLSSLSSYMHDIFGAINELVLLVKAKMQADAEDEAEDEEEPSPVEVLAEALKVMPPAQVNVTAPAVNVSVPPAQITVMPAPKSKGFRARVTERDGNGYIKEVSFQEVAA